MFPTAEGFDTLLVVTDETSGPLSASVRTKVYRSMDEVAVDWNSTDKIYEAANAAFSQSPMTKTFKAGFRVLANPVDDELDEIQAYDQDWYGLAFTSELRDVAGCLLAAAWCESRTKLYFMATNDVDTENPADTANYAHQVMLLGYDRTASVYHQTATLYPDVALASRLLSVNFFSRNSTITAKFKRLRGITPIDVDSAGYTAITGFVPGTGLDDTAGHFANTYISLGGVEFNAEGNVASGEWIDTMHFVDWLTSAIQNEILGRLVTVGKIPYTNVGVRTLVDAVEDMLQLGVTNGGIASEIDEEGNTVPEFEVTVANVQDVPAAQRAARIAPDITFVARLAGAIHYATVTGRVLV
jgi:hypothetical protein